MLLPAFSTPIKKILRVVAIHPTRGIVHGAAFLRAGEVATERGADLRNRLMHEGCSFVSPIVAHTAADHENAFARLSREEQLIRYRERKW